MPGSGKQSADVQQQIIEFLEAGIDPTTIHRRLKVGRSSIYRMKRCLQQHGTAYAPPETNKKNGRPKVMTAEQEQVSFWKPFFRFEQLSVVLPQVSNLRVTSISICSGSTRIRKENVVLTLQCDRRKSAPGSKTLQTATAT
jgi:hypothetical protein